MKQWNEIRHKVLVEMVSKRQIRRDYRIGSETLEKILANAEPPGYRKSAPRPKPKLGEFIAVVDQILIDDRDAPVKQRHTAKRIFERLRDEHGYEGCESQVRAAVAERRLHAREVFVPLSQPPGEAQFDFGEATVIISGDRVKAALSVMTLPYSDVFDVNAYPRECTETFQHSHATGFERFGGVPTKVAYDNTSIAVKKVLLGPERELTRAFLALKSHYLFDHRFCRVARGNEKGHVENLVGYGRRNFLVPVPSFESFEELNEHLHDACTRDLERSVRGKHGSKLERFAEDQAAMLALPQEAFEARRIEQRRASSLSLVRFDRNDYSVPTAYAHHELTVIGGVDEIRVTSADELIATHERHWGREHVSYDPVHYLALLERKPGAFDAARPLERWELPECFLVLRRRMEAEHGHRGRREFIKVLRLLESSTIRQLAGAVEAAINLGCEDVDAIRLILEHRAEAPIPLFSLDGHPNLKPFALDPPDLSAYSSLTNDVLTQQGA